MSKSLTMKLIITLNLIIIQAIAFSQNQITLNEKHEDFKLEIMDTISSVMDTGRIEILENNTIGVLLEKFNSTKKNTGYRIQIHSGLSRVETLKSQTNFMKLYPNMNTYVIYQQPNFKLRVGDFEERLSVNKFYEEMKEIFPGAFIIKDEITPVLN